MWRSERGMSLVEMVVAMSLMLAVVGVFGPVLTSAMNSGKVVQDQSRAIDEIRIAVARIDKELRSAQCISAPLAGQSGSTLTFVSLAGTGGAYTVTYSVAPDGHLTRTRGGVCQPVGEGLVVTSEEFSHLTNAGQRGEIVIKLQVRFENGTSPRAVETTIAGRNAWAAC